MAIEAGDDVLVDDGEFVVAHVRRAGVRDVIIFVEDRGDFTLPRSLVAAAGNNRVVFRCRDLPLKLRAMIGHLHGESFEDAD